MDITLKEVGRVLVQVITGTLNRMEELGVVVTIVHLEERGAAVTMVYLEVLGVVILMVPLEGTMDSLMVILGILLEALANIPPLMGALAVDLEVIEDSQVVMEVWEDLEVSKRISNLQNV